MIREFGKAFSGVGTHMISRTRLGHRKGERASWVVGIKTSARGVNAMATKAVEVGQSQVRSHLRYAEAFELYFVGHVGGWGGRHEFF